MNPSRLEILNAHPRDAHIVFDEGPHIYTIDGDSDYKSVTTWNHSHFKDFDGDAIATKIIERLAANPDPSNKYHGMTKEQILAGWEVNRDAAAKAGTKMHFDIECFYNDLEVENDSAEFGYFLDFHEDNQDLEPFRTEWMVWDKELKLAGSIDMVFVKPDGRLMIYDWKRSKAIVRNKPFEGRALPPCINHLPDTNFWHYSLQLNTYKAIIERQYGFEVDELRLVCLHPDKKKYEVYDVPDLQSEVSELFALRKQQLIST